MRLSANFTLSELVAPDIIDTVGNRAADFLHPELVPTIQRLRDEFGSIVVNGTYNGQTFTESGLRSPKTRTGAALSAHRFGVACDLKFYGTTPEGVQRHILKHASKYPCITRIENAEITKSWLHIEVGDRNGAIYVFNP